MIAALTHPRHHDLAATALHALLGVGRVVVQSTHDSRRGRAWLSTHDPAAGAGVVILHELVRDGELGQAIGPVGLQEESALVTVDRGQKHGAMELGGKLVHRAGGRG